MYMVEKDVAAYNGLLFLNMSKFKRRLPLYFIITVFMVLAVEYSMNISRPSEIWTR